MPLCGRPLSSALPNVSAGPVVARRSFRDPHTHHNALRGTRLEFTAFMVDTSNISVWLAILAIATALQTLFLFGAAFVVWRTARKTQTAIDRFEQRHLEPLMARVNGAVDDARDVMARARSIDDNVRAKVANATDHAKDAAELVTERVWPAYAFGRGAYAAVSSFIDTFRARRRPRPMA